MPSNWDSIAPHAARLASARLRSLQAESGRRDRLALRAGPLLLDLTRQRIDGAALDALLSLARGRNLGGAIASLFAGERVNRSEDRPALHVALRARDPAPGDASPAAAAARLAQAEFARMGALVDEIRTAFGAGIITDFVHVGIGGSDLGPRLVAEALAGLASGGPRLHFVANVDGGAVARLMDTLDPARTFVCLVSKSFTTQETLLNGEALVRWFAGTGGDRAHALSKSLVAVTANPPAALAFGVPSARVLSIWDWVGGRYSLWSAVGLPVAVALGMPVFRELLAGAHAMDRHYACAPLERNLPVLLALASIWNRNALGLPTRAVIPYDDRLRLLPGWLQQLAMESNGKGVDHDGRPLARPAAPVIWGDVGTNAQHAFFQSLHQGIDVIPVEFVAAIHPDHALVANHHALLANLLAQSVALMDGTGAANASDAHAAQRACPGGRPSTTLLLDRLTPASLGMLLAAYEHQVHAEGAIWGLNSFDQFGVELGKQVARGLLPAVAGGPVPAGTDATTAALIAEIRGPSAAPGSS
jgi:glucose-6-phosphate isomerase